MPNWCSNDLYVSGPEKELKEFMNELTNTVDVPRTERTNVIEICQTFLPLPDDAYKIEEIADGTTLSVFTDTGYDTACDLWGSKWGDCDTGMDVDSPHYDGDKSYANFQYQSAWGPITEGLLKISKLFPGLLFEERYSEAGMCFRGINLIRDGEIVEQDYQDYSFGGYTGTSIKREITDDEDTEIWERFWNEWDEFDFQNDPQALWNEIAEGVVDSSDREK